MIQQGVRVTYLDSGYTAVVLESGIIPADDRMERYRGQQGYLVRWELLDEQTTEAIIGSDGGESWLPADQIRPV